MRARAAGCGCYMASLGCASMWAPEYGNGQVGVVCGTGEGYVKLLNEDGSITDGFGHCLSIDAGAHGIDANVAATNISCKSSACTAGARCVKWTRGSGGTLQNGQGCVDVGSGGGISASDVRFEPAAAAARTGPEQAYCNASAPSWGGGVIKIGSVYHMWVITMRNCSDPNDPNIGDPFVDTGKETPLVAPFMYKMHHFTKTGSGQT